MSRTRIVVQTDAGPLLIDRATALRLVRDHLDGATLVDDLMDERRAEARADDTI